MAVRACLGGDCDGDGVGRLCVLHPLFAQESPGGEEEEAEHGPELRVVDVRVHAVQVEGDELDYEGLAHGHGARDEEREAHEHPQVLEAEVVCECGEEGGEGAVAEDGVGDPGAHEGPPRGEEQEDGEEQAHARGHEQAQGEGDPVEDVANHGQEENARGRDQVEELNVLVAKVLAHDLHGAAVAHARGDGADVKIHPEHGHSGPDEQGDERRGEDLVVEGRLGEQDCHEHSLPRAADGERGRSRLGRGLHARGGLLAGKEGLGGARLLLAREGLVRHDEHRRHERCCHHDAVAEHEGAAGGVEHTRHQLDEEKDGVGEVEGADDHGGRRGAAGKEVGGVHAGVLHARTEAGDEDHPGQQHVE
mmetsp:Transcript_18007/g.56409  ORF Transcript_18007/g.56409 Transcript_18007/m.56409 type:complete len:363 (-) Transcript_18007:415-1503(-)